MVLWWKEDVWKPAPGRFARYELIELVNSGGMAEIWLATDGCHQQTYAVRILNPHAQRDRSARRRFLNGCEVLRALQGNPAVIGYVEHGRWRGIPYLVMEYVEALNLKLLMARHDPLLEEHLAEILIQAAEALEYVHERGYVHLDFKPENILVKRSGQIKLIDFDIAIKKPPHPLRLKSYPGTPAYMAPEMLLRKEVDHRADVFSFGVVAYELVTLQKPFPGENAEEVLRRQLDRKLLVPPRQINPSVPKELEELILRCLEPDPNRRLGVMHLVVKSLNRILYVSG